MVEDLQCLDYYVYVCLKNTIHNTPKAISKYLKVDYPHIYNSLNRLIKVGKVQKTIVRPAEYLLIEEKMDLKENLDRIKDDPALILGLCRVMMDNSKVIRKIFIKTVIEKSYQKEAQKEWLSIDNDEKEEWIKKNILGENFNVDVFINACYMLKNTKDEKMMLRYIVENTKQK